MMGFFPLLEGFEVNMPSAYMDFCRAREREWDRSCHKTGLEDQIFRYDFRRTIVGDLPMYFGMNRSRLTSGESSKSPAVLHGDTTFYSRQASTPTTYEFCCAALDTYHRRWDGTPTDDVLPTPEVYIPPDNDRVSVLDAD